MIPKNNSKKEYVRNFKDITRKDVGIAGGKGASLGEMINSDMPVPEGFVVLSSAFEDFIKESRLSSEIDSTLKTVNIDEIHTVENASEKIQALIKGSKISKELIHSILKEYSKLDSEYVAVRSSATSEDSASAAWAGQLDTYLNTTKDKLLDNIRRCWASLYTPRAIFYRIEKKLHNQKVSVAVVVQKMVDSEVSGIAFSVHPVTQDRNQIIIEAGYGLGEAIVSGQITPDSYVVHKKGLEIIEKNISTQNKKLVKAPKGDNVWVNITGDRQKLSDEQVQELSKIIINIEKHYGFPCDIEWAFEKGKFYITQSRPITTLTENNGQIAKAPKDILEEKSDITNPTIEMLRKQKFIRYMRYPEVPLLYIESACTYSVNNKYYKIINIKKYPDFIILLDPSFEAWKAADMRITITDKSIIKRIIKDLKSSTDKHSKYFDIWLSKKSTKYSTKEIIDAIDNLNKASEEIYKTYDFFNSECFHPEDKNLIKTLQQLRDRISMGPITKLFDSYEKVLSVISRQCSIKRSIIDRATTKELKDFLNNPNIDMTSIEDRPICLAYLENKLRYHFGKEASAIREYLEREDPQKEMIKKAASDKIIRGVSVYPGKISGKVIKLDEKDYFSADKVIGKNTGYILVTPMTRPEMMPYIKKAAAFITDEGGMTSHAAIVARELKKPCITQTHFATELLNDGDQVEVDADNGIVMILENNSQGSSLQDNNSIKFTEAFSREISVYGVMIWNEADRDGLSEILKKGISQTLIIKKPDSDMTSFSYMRKELDDFDILIANKIKNDRSFFKNLSQNFKKYWKLLKPYANGKKPSSIKEFKEFSQILQKWWPLMSLITWIPATEKISIKGQEVKEAIALREETQEFSGKICDMPTKWFKKLCSKYASIADFMTYDEMIRCEKLSKTEKSEIASRKNGYFVYNGKIYPYSELQNFCKDRRIIFNADTGKDIYEKMFRRDFCLPNIEIWCRGESTEPRQWTEKEQPKKPYIIFERINGAVNCYMDQKGVDWIKKELSRLVAKDPHYVEKAVDIFVKKNKKLSDIFSSEKTLNYKELVYFMNEHLDAWPWFEATWWLMELYSDRPNSKEFQMLKKAREETNEYGDGCDRIIIKSLKKIFPELGPLSQSLTIEEITTKKIPSKDILKRRMEYYIFTDAKLLDVPLKSIEEEYNIKISVSTPIDAYELHGQTAYPGKISGRARIIVGRNNVADLQKGEVLVTSMTTVDFVPAMKKAAAIITNEGGVTCHAAIIARELKKPCIIGTKEATHILKTGDLVEVDATSGTIRIIKDENLDRDIILEKMFSREHSLFYVSIWNSDSYETGRELFLSDIRKTLYIKEPNADKIQGWFNKEEVATAWKKLEDGVRKNPKHFELIKKVSDEHFRYLLPFLQDKKYIRDIKELKIYYDHWMAWWSPMSILMEMADHDFPKGMMKEAIKLRETTQDYADSIDNTFLNFFLKKYPQLKKYAYVLTPKEVFILEDRPFNIGEIKRFEERLNGYILIDNKVLPIKELESRLKECGFVLKDKEPGSDKLLMINLQSREHSLTYCYVWNISNQEESKDFFESVKQLIFINKGIHTKTDVWYHEKELSDINDYCGNKSHDKKWLSKVKREFWKYMNRLIPYSEGKKIKSMKELRQYYNDWIAWWAPMAVMFVLPESKTAEKKVGDEALKIRSDTEKYSDDNDRVVMETFKRLHPEFKDIAELMSPSEIFNCDKLRKEDINIIKQRSNGYVLFNGKLYPPESLDKLLYDNNLVLETHETNVKDIKGEIASTGNVRGIARLIHLKTELSGFKDGEILITEMTSPDYVPTMKKSAAIVTDEGGRMCHAAIVSRELKKPCIVGTKIATKVIKTGDLIEVNADTGIITILNKVSEIKSDVKETHKLDLAKLYQTQISLTEWFNSINHHLSDEMRVEDNEKRERLSVLNKIINIPFDRPVQFTAEDITNKTKAFQKYLAGHGNELCAMRLIALDPKLPKLRMRGKTVRQVVEEWYPNQNIDPKKYRIDFVPHSEDYLWSTIFIITKNGIFGEIITGTHAQLTQGFHEKDKPISFSYDFNEFKFDKENADARRHVEKLMKMLLIKDLSKRKELQKKLNATFSNNYLEGYFETITSKTFGIWFCDYNRIIGRLYDDFRYNISNNASDINDKTLVGQSGNSGKATGKVRIMNNANDMFENGDILVCVMTTPEYISIMQKASAIVTDLGGILSHAAIIARELKKPCVVGTGNATTILKDGMKVEVDADKGTVRIIEKTGNKILEKFLDKIDHNPITKQEGNFSIMLYGGLFPGASKKYMSRHYDIDFGAFVFFSSGVHGTLFFDMQRYLETTRSGFHKFMDGKFSDIEDFHRLWKIIDQIYGQMKGFHKLTEEKIIETIKRLYSILCQLMVATVFSEALDKNLVKEFFDYLKLNLDYEEFYDKSTLTSFESFEMKFDKILSQYKKEDATKFMWIGTDYFKGIPLASANDILSRKIIEKGGQNSIRKSYEDIQKKVIANKKIVNVYRKTLDTRSQRLFDYIQTAYYIRDVRKEPLQKILTIITQLINEFVTRNNKPISVAPYVSVYDFEERYKDPNYFTEIEQRVKGFMLYGEDGYYKFEYESLDSLKEEFFKEMEKEISHNSDGIKGVIGSRGFAKGQVKIILSEKDFHKFESGDIIVADMTRPEYVSLMKKASGIITDEGSITCHAAIISRELGLPCIIGTRNATRILKDGDVVELDANNGVVKVLSDKKASSSEINYSEWEFEFQQRDEHPIIMADYWCRSAAMNFSKELGIKDMSFDYIYTSLSKGYCKKHQKQSIIGYLQNCSLDGLEMIAEKTRKRVMALEKFHIRLSKTDIKNQNRAAFTGLWKEFDEMFRELIPWYFFPYYVTGENMLVDRLKNTLKNYKRKIEDVTDFNNAVNILIFPTKKMEFQKERDAFYDLIKSNTNETMMRNYLKDFGWMSTFLILPREKLSYEKLLSKIKETDKKDFTEEYSIQEESKKNNNLIEAKLLRIIKDDKKLMRTIKLSKEFGYLLTWSVERSLMIFSEMQEFFEETSSRLGIKKDDYIHLTYEEIISGLSKNRPYDIEERKKGYVYIMENGKAKLITGSEASIIARDIDTKLSAIDENIRELNGQSAYPGIIKGKARIIPFAKDSSQLQEGEILVCPMTSPEYLPAMKKSGAIITDEGGLLSHAAIISREFHKPCIVGTKIATRLIKNGDILEVDANKGVVRIIK